MASSKNANLEIAKRSKRKQTFEANNLPEIDVETNILMASSEYANLPIAKRSGRKQTFEANNLPEIDVEETNLPMASSENANLPIAKRSKRKQTVEAKNIPKLIAVGASCNQIFETSNLPGVMENRGNNPIINKTNLPMASSENANLPTAKRSKRKQNFEANNLPEIDDEEKNPPMASSKNVSLEIEKCLKRKQIFETSNLPGVMENRGNNPIINKPCRTVEDRRSQKTGRDKASKYLSQQYNEINPGKDILNELFTAEELATLENAGMPQPVSPEKLTTITEAIHEDYHSEIVVCAVCDEMFPHSETKLFGASHLPSSFFSVLRKPSASPDGDSTLHPLLLQQYDVNHYFPTDSRFQGLLISPRGVEIHRKNCSIEIQNCCECKLYICVTNGCLTALQKKRIPKFSIANGNYIGQLPEAIREMTFASRSLIRPVTSFGRMGSYSDTSGTRLTGHIYSNRLNTALVRQKLPMAPADTAIRVLIVSPMASDQSTVSRAKLASVKSDYIVEREKIASSLLFFRNVGNKVMKNVEVDQDTINNLPSDKTSVDMVFTTEIEETEDPHQDSDLVQSAGLDNGTGGPSLSRSSEEFLDGVFESATVTIGAPEREEINDHEKIARVLTTILDDGTSLSDMTSHDEMGTNNTSSTYVVRPEKDFASDSNPDYLELHYPDLFPFGRGGFGEQRKNQISRQALVKHLLNLSTRQFQQVDFVLPIYDMVTRQQVSNMAYVRSILPSRLSGPERGTSSKGEAYGRVPMEDLKAAHDYKVVCADAANRGLRFPPPPTSLNGLAMDFYTDIRLATQPMQHSEAAANRNRQMVYAAHNSLGKAQIWFTVSPDDTQSFKIVWYALGAKGAYCKNPVPAGDFRFKLLAKHPVAAALHFQRIMKIVVRRVIGWNKKEKLPYKSGGVFGVSKGYLGLVEEQSRLTLHAHFLIWLYGHENIERQLQTASQLDECETKNLPFVDHDLFKNTAGNSDEEHFTHVAKVLKLLAKNIESFSTGELLLPETEMTLITKCPVYNCPGKLELASNEAQEKLRSRPSNIDVEAHGLKCPVCKVTYTVTSRIDAALESGYRRCFGKQQLSKKEVIDLIWLGMPLQPNVEDVEASDRWLLNFASIQVLVNMHDWKHRSSCFKNRRLLCRYNTPHDTVAETNVTPVYPSFTDITEGEDSTVPKSKDIVYLNISLKKRAVFMFMTDCNPTVLAVLGCNNCTRYVENQKVSLYYGAYASKYSTENGKALAELMRALNAHEERRLLKQQQMAEQTENEAMLNVVPDNDLTKLSASIGYARLLSGARAATNGETVGAPIASYCALGNDLFVMSHDTAALPVPQARAFIRSEKLTASVNDNGIVLATIHDYVYRSSNDPIIETMNYWNFISSQEKCQLKSHFKDIEESDMESTEFVQRGRFQHKFNCGHPQFETHGHWERKNLHWPSYSGLRVPDVLGLVENSDLNIEELALKREQYAEDVLIMFYPFRTLNDLFDENGTWWSSYLKRKPLLDANEKTVDTLHNMQNYYESFCRKNCLSEDHLFKRGDPIPAVPRDDIDDDIVNLLDVENTSSSPAGVQNAKSNSATDPFVKLLSSFNENPVRLKLVSGFTLVTPEQARSAINVLPTKNSSKKSVFTLPGRSQVGALVEDPKEDPMNSKVFLDAPVGTRVELLQNIEKALSNRSNCSSPITTNQPAKLEPNFPTLQQQSQHWGLNEKQHMAFVLIGSALLQHIALANSVSSGNSPIQIALLTANINDLLKKIMPNPQLILFLSGSGGTGKSRVIQTFVDFARRWHSTASVVVCASSGVAAVLIGGCTLHSALGISARMVDSDPSSDQIIAWSEIGLLILDEFSMIQPALFDFMKRRLEKLKGNSKPYGAIHLVLVGDFYQLSPVGVTIYKLPTRQENNSDEHSLASMRARVAWKECLTDVIELTENLRQTDTRWADSQKRWRVNQPTKQDIDDVNKRFIYPTSAVTSSPPLGTVIAVPENQSREEALKFCEVTMLSNLPLIQRNSTDWRNRGVLLIEASISKSSGHQTVDLNQAEYIRSLGSKRLKAPGNLYCFIGAPYMVTINSDVCKGVANGTDATLEDICLRDSAVIRVTKLDDGTMTHAVYAEDVLCLVFKHTASGWSESLLYPRLDKGCFPLVVSKNCVKCRLGKSEKTFQIQVSQFPCVLSVVLTGHKVQGKTLDAIILGYLSKHHLYGSSGWIYVILSRVRKLSDFYTLTRLNTDVKKYKPRTHVIREMKRLSAIENVTIRRLKTVFDEFDDF